MKSRSHFKFKRFSVADDQCSMKVGTDAVLLAAWADLSDATRILDIGTGTGVVALIAAQRTSPDCLIHGVEIQALDCAQAAANVAASPWAGRITIIQSAIQDFHPTGGYDVILCNPPYFINSLLPPAHGRTTARHTVSLDHDTLIASAGRLLSNSGKASFILPPEEGDQFRIGMEAHGMSMNRLCRFRTREGKKVERLLMTFGHAASSGNNCRNPVDVPAKHSRVESRVFQESEIQLYDHEGRWTPEYAHLVQDLYLSRP